MTLPRATAPLSTLVGTVVAFLAACSEPAGPDSGPPTLPVFNVETPAMGIASASLFSVGKLRRASPRSACRAAEHRQFDFWLGTWDVRGPEGGDLGNSMITSDLAGCLVEEDFSFPIAAGPFAGTSFRGKSLNMYDAAADVWFQNFQSNNSVAFRIAGGLVDTEMIMIGTQQAFGFERTSRITWTPNPDGSVRQLIESSFGGGPFNPGFDGLYFPVDELDRLPPGAFGICRNGGFDEFDFATGDWNVRSEGGLDLGSSTIVEDDELDNCILQERHTGPKGYEARSFQYYDRFEDRWFRTFIDTDGLHLLLEGGLVDGAMVLTGTRPLPGNQGELHVRNVWESRPEGGLRQTWDVSRDGGATWETDLALIYEPGG